MSTERRRAILNIMSSVPPRNKNVSEANEFDPSKKAGSVLDYILDTELSEAPETQEDLVSAESAMRGRPVIDVATGRTKSRVLFVTTNESVLHVGSESANWYKDVSKLFDEVHVMVLISRAGSNNHERYADNLWVYRVQHKHWWRLPWVAAQAADVMFTFLDTVRPDVVVGVDPYEAGLASYIIAKNFQRPLQLHVSSDFSSPAWLQEDEQNHWRKHMAKYVLKRVSSVRTSTSVLKDKLVAKFKNILDINVLPQHYNFAGFKTAVPTFSVREKYPDYSFIILATGPLTADSHLHDTFTALRKMLLNVRIGLVVLGKGPAKQLFVEKTKLLGIEKSVVFVNDVENLSSYMKTANLFVCTDTKQDSEVMVLRAAAAGLPAVMYETDLRKDLFTDGKSAFLSPVGDIEDLSQKVSKFINNNMLRVTFSEAASYIVESRIHEDIETYYASIRNSIEFVLVNNDVDGAVEVEETSSSESKSDSEEQVAT